MHILLMVLVCWILFSLPFSLLSAQVMKGAS